MLSYGHVVHIAVLFNPFFFGSVFGYELFEAVTVNPVELSFIVGIFERIAIIRVRFFNILHRNVNSSGVCARSSRFVAIKKRGVVVVLVIFVGYARAVRQLEAGDKIAAVDYSAVAGIVVARGKHAAEQNKTKHKCQQSDCLFHSFLLLKI